MSSCQQQCWGFSRIRCISICHFFLSILSGIDDPIVTILNFLDFWSALYERNRNYFSDFSPCVYFSVRTKCLSSHENSPKIYRSSSKFSSFRSTHLDFDIRFQVFECYFQNSATFSQKIDGFQMFRFWFFDVLV